MTALESFSECFATPEGIPRGAVSISSLTGSADAFLALTIAADGGRVVVAITPGIPDADRLSDDLKVLSDWLREHSPKSAADTTPRLLEFPPSVTGDRSSLGARTRTIAALRAREILPYPCVIVAPFAALTSPIPSADIPALTLAPGCRFADISSRLAALGYERVPMVEKEGDWSVRGGIIDAWSPGDEFPVRAEFFGDDLESLRSFDAATQRSIARIDTAELMPVGSGDYAGNGTFLLDALPPDAAILALEHNSYNLETVAAKLPNDIVYTGDPAPRGVRSHAFQTSPLPGFAEMGAEAAHHPELFDAARARLDRHIASAEQRGALVARIDGLSNGFEVTSSRQCRDEEAIGNRQQAIGEAIGNGLVVVTKADRVFTKKKTRAAHGAKAAGGAAARLNDFDEIEPGEYVVHVDYGVGRFLGSSEIKMDGKRSEVFTIEYGDGAKLHVPAAHAHLLSRYVGVKGETVRLHRLDGKRWDKDKAAAQKAVADLASALLDTQAKRETMPGYAYDINCDGIDAFEAAFPYEETPDQREAIAAIKADMAGRKPMDRLVCGDAGYGKTEVAMRAAFIAAMNGRQTVVLAPTTVLAEQHFETFTSRFDGTPIRIESVSRFQSADTRTGTFKRLASGACDIVIGTHAVLSSKVAFHDLGLIIIDEEQRFGVRHKEFLKRLRATADVLTLSATPIPRTLYLSMTGARDLSLLRTPPRERVAVETVVVRDSDEIVRAAIESELERGGQVFVLHNRVNTIERVEKRLKALCPRLRIVVAHGQMDARTLARKMRDFERGDFDVLLSTTIIESGIDIPRANTIIIDQAHTFGLADLYQLRGRVGRSTRQGRAVFLLPRDGMVDSDARERLAALKRHGGLGAGFNLAVRDLELRGAGNLLGSQQSGHIAAVGFGLYCQLLQRTVAMMKGERVREVVDVKLNLDFIDYSPASEDENAIAALPYGYVEEDAQRMGFMKRFAEAMDIKTVKEIATELQDRFGRLPPGARRLVRLAELRVRCANARITHVDAKGERAVFYKDGSRDVAFVCDLKGKNADRKIAELLRAVSREGNRE